MDTHSLIYLFFSCLFFVFFILWFFVEPLSAVFSVFLFVVFFITFDLNEYFEKAEFRKIKGEIIKIVKEENHYYIKYINEDEVILPTIFIPQEQVFIRSFSGTQKNTIEGNIKLSKYDSIIKDEKNKLYITLPNHLSYKGSSYFYNEFDFKYNLIENNNCYESINYKNGLFTFYKLENELLEFKFKERYKRKVNFIKNREDNQICLDFSYYLSYNNEILKIKGHENKINVYVNKDFKLSDLNIN